MATSSIPRSALRWPAISSGAHGGAVPSNSVGAQCSAATSPRGNRHKDRSTPLEELNVAHTVPSGSPKPMGVVPTSTSRWGVRVVELA